MLLNEAHTAYPCKLRMGLQGSGALQYVCHCNCVLNPMNHLFTVAMETTVNCRNLDPSYNLWLHYIQNFCGFSNNFSKFWGQMKPKSPQIRIFRLPWQHLLLFLNFGSSSSQGPSFLKISSF